RAKSAAEAVTGAASIAYRRESRNPGRRSAVLRFRAYLRSFPARLLRFQAADQHVDQVGVRMAFEAALTQRLDDFRCRDRRVVRTKEHTGDRNLHARRLRRRKEPRQLLQALAVRNMLSREGVECADLDFGVARM